MCSNNLLHPDITTVPHQNIRMILCLGIDILKSEKKALDILQNNLAPDKYLAIKRKPVNEL